MQKKAYFFYLLFCLLSIISCGNNDQTNEIQTVMVKFFNDSSYKIVIHQGSFYGPIIAEIAMTGGTSSVPIRVNDDNNLTVFSIYYIIYPIDDDINNEYSEVFASCYDPDVQIENVIKAGQPITIHVPQPNPKNLVCKSAFIRITNTFNLPIRLRYASRNINQANNILPIAPYQNGLYKIDNIPDEGENCQYYNIATMFESTNFSDFITENGDYITKNAYTYYFTFNGNTILKNGEPKSLVVK